MLVYINTYSQFSYKRFAFKQMHLFTIFLICFHDILHRKSKGNLVY